MTKKEMTKKEMTGKKNNKKAIAIVGILIAITIIALLFILLKKPGEIKDFASYAGSIEDIEIPDGVKVVSLGEAAHGNKEFQELKLSVFKHLVETTDIRAFILEGDFGGCALINDYIQGGEGDIKEITSLLGYRIYKTDSMMELIEWMRSYNESANEDDKVRIYGVDIQYDTRCLTILSEFYNTVDVNKATTFEEEKTKMFGVEEDGYNPDEYDQIIAWINSYEEDIKANMDTYSEASSEYDTACALQSLQNLTYYMEYREKEKRGNKYRDNCMFENVKWILSSEEMLGRSAVMLSAHNGHITKNLSTNYTFLGNQLYNEYGSEYFAIGTDYYNTCCNLPSNGKRVCKNFCSNDPLAYQLKYTGENIAYLDFEKAKASDILTKKINGIMSTGSLGEQYTPLMKVLPYFSHIYQAPSQMFDSMIYVYEASPITVWEE